jgi:5-methylcytosine-specific restriction endonuclease McrBC regulatory subunit McrC
MELTENAPAAPVALTPSAAAKVAEASSYWRKALKLREEPLRLTVTGTGKYLLEVRGVAGFIRIDELNLEIAPKFLNRASCGPGWRAAMWRFLAYGYGVEALSDAGGQGAKDEGIADVLAELFLTTLRGASARGYPLGYSHKRMNSAFLRGRLAPKKYGNLLPVSGRVDIIAAQLTTDIPTNRLLKWAGNQLASAVEDAGRRRRLLAWSAELPGVQPVLPRSHSIPPPRRHHPYLVHAVEIAKLLQDDRLAGYQPGELTVPGFLWDSESLFERAMRRLFHDACRPLGIAVAKERLKLARMSDEGRETSTYTTPDMTMRRGVKAVLHADAKYKVLREHPGNEDFYQVLAAGRVSDIDTVALVYPSHGAEIRTKCYKPFGTGRPYTAFTTTVGLEAFATGKGIRLLRERLRATVALWLSPEA